ncbi:MAG: orotidine-5'-phosphate decarboxylase, partial [Candidatus Saccharibacteria bacterium]
MNIIDRLNKRIIELKAPIVVGLDPDIEKIPSFYFSDKQDTFQGVCEAILNFNKDIIDIVKNYVPAVKPQIAFYEMFGHEGIRTFEQTVIYAKSQGLIVVEDGKRNDIGNTAQAYASGHLGSVKLIHCEVRSPFDVDFLTISPFLGPESLEPFIETAKRENKGLFILAKTSNKGSGLIQDIRNQKGRSVSEELALFIDEKAASYKGVGGYSPIGAVVGATYPQEAHYLRKLMPKSLFLVPGFGAQGGTAVDVVPCFNPDGLGAIINASR